MVMLATVELLFYTTCVPGFSLHHCFGTSSKCLVEKTKAIAVTLSYSESLMSSFGTACPSYSLTTVTNTMTKGTVGRKGFISSYNSQVTLHY